VAAAVGRYELVRAIGRGGMAEVFLARRRGAAGIHKRLVVKRVRQDLTSDPRFAEMFLREARVATNLSHKNIVTVFDVGRDEEGLFLAMDYVDGPDLAAALERAVAREKSFDPLLAAHIGSEVAAGLDYAHRQCDEKGATLGLVHRDVTPRNILLSLDGEVKVTDFGVAVLGSEGSDKRRGTLQYMSPEQARGDSIDARADVFSLGLVLHELLGGQRVYRGGGKDEILAQARIAKVPRLGGEVPEVLIEAVARATAESPADRFATARAMQRELDTWVVAERGRRGQADPLDHTLSEFLTSLFPDWSERTEEDALKGSAGAAGTATMQSVAETVGLDPETASRVQVLAASRAARQTRPPPESPSSRRNRAIAFAAGVLVAVAAVAVALGVMSARRGDADPAPPAPRVEPVAARAEIPPPSPAPPPTPVAVLADAAPAGPPVGEPEPPEPPPPQHKNPTGPSATAKQPTGMGALDLNAVPWAYVSINGGPEEETPIKARKLPAGKHKVLIRNPVLERHREMTIEISPGETSKYVVDLRQ